VNFYGAGHHLAYADLERCAKLLGCDVAAIRAFLDVETNGLGFAEDNRVIILFEPHVFFRLLASHPEKRALAVAAGVAYAKQGTKPYPKTQHGRYTQLEKACDIDEEAALKSCSWGIGQVMGYNFKLAGYPTVYALVDACRISEGKQLEACCNFIKNTKLDAALRKRDWAGFARGYNGPSYAANHYDTKLAEAYQRALVVVAQEEKEPMASTLPPWPPELDADAVVFGDMLKSKYNGNPDMLGWVRWSSDWRIHRANGVDNPTAMQYVSNDIDTIRGNPLPPGQSKPPAGEYDVPWPPELDQEADLFGQKLSALYREKQNREVDVLGWVRWSSDFRVLRANGLTFDQTWYRIENSIREIWGLPPLPPPPSTFPKRTGVVAIDNRCLKDDGGKFLSLVHSYFHGPATLETEPQAFNEDTGILARSGFNGLRQFCYLDRNWVNPDPWQYMGNKDVSRFMRAVKQAYANGLRTLVVFFGGVGNYPTRASRKQAVQALINEIKANRHMFCGGEITNEFWMNWSGLFDCSMEELRELVNMVADQLPGFPIAVSSPVSGEQGTIPINEWFQGVKDMYYGTRANRCGHHYDRTDTKIDKIWRPYRQCWDNMIHVPSPDQNQNVAEFLGLAPGTQLTPTFNSNQEPIGTDSSGVQDDNPDRQVIGIVITYVAGGGEHVLHDDFGVWQDGIHPQYRRGDPNTPGSRGVTGRLMQSRNKAQILNGITGMMKMLPGDLPNWHRTRHGIADHPFAPSFQQGANGFSQIWPDGITAHGVVRAYCAIKGNDWVMPLLGVKDHFDAKMAHKSRVVFFAAGGWEKITEGTYDAGQTVRITYPEVVAIGQYI